LLICSFEEGGRKELVKVLVGVNRNFKLRMRLRARRGATENAPWELVGRRPASAPWQVVKASLVDQRSRAIVKVVDLSMRFFVS
jgi:hypothetical protein